MFSKTQFQKHQTTITLVLLGAFFMINALINATTEIMEAMRTPPLSFARWEPFVWEYTSALSSFVAVIWLAKMLSVYPWNWQRTSRSLGLYCMFALAFSLIHIALMVVMRESIYWLLGSNYTFASTLEQWAFELLYELRKDVWSFVFFTILIWSYRYIVAQWLGDATDIALETKKNNYNAIDAEPTANNAGKQNDLLLIKKHGREFLVNKNDIEWIEASGNYLNLHIDDQVFPMRDTFKSFLNKNTHLPIQRVHRSYAVNVNFVNNLSLTASGDGSIELLSGQTVRMSRRFKLLLD